MKHFLINILKLILLTVSVLLFSLFFVPDIVSESSLLSALPNKHKLVSIPDTCKIILIGGSNISFGMESKIIETQLKKPVVNMGIHAGIGLEFMVNDIKPFIKKGDLIILFPEYEHFYTNDFYGGIELASVVFDIEPQSKKLLSAKQWLNLVKYLPTYSAKKIKNFIPSLFRKKNIPVNVYHRFSFNEYGDAYIHWNLSNENYAHALKEKDNEIVNEEVIVFLKEFNLYVNSQGAQLLIFPPVIDSTSFNNKKIIITKIAKELKNNDIAFVTEPLNYCYNDTLFFNSYYHLNKKGVDKRTQQLLMDLERLKIE